MLRYFAFKCKKKNRFAFDKFKLNLIRKCQLVRLSTLEVVV